MSDVLYLCSHSSLACVLSLRVARSRSWTDYDRTHIYTPPTHTQPSETACFGPHIPARSSSCCLTAIYTHCLCFPSLFNHPGAGQDGRPQSRGWLAVRSYCREKGGTLHICLIEEDRLNTDTYRQIRKRTPANSVHLTISPLPLHFLPLSSRASSSRATRTSASRRRSAPLRTSRLRCSR